MSSTEAFADLNHLPEAPETDSSVFVDGKKPPTAVEKDSSEAFLESTAQTCESEKQVSLKVNEKLDDCENGETSEEKVDDNESEPAEVRTATPELPEKQKVEGSVNVVKDDHAETGVEVQVEPDDTSQNAEDHTDTGTTLEEHTNCTGEADIHVAAHCEDVLKELVVPNTDESGNTEDIINSRKRENLHDNLLLVPTDTTNTTEKVSKSPEIENIAENFVDIGINDCKDPSSVVESKICLEERQFNENDTCDIVHKILDKSKNEDIQDNLPKHAIDTSKSVDTVYTAEGKSTTGKSSEVKLYEIENRETKDKPEKSILANSCYSSEAELKPAGNESEKQEAVVNSENSSIEPNENTDEVTVKCINSTCQGDKSRDEIKESNCKVSVHTDSLIKTIHEHTVTEVSKRSVPEQLNDTLSGEYKVIVDSSDKKYIEISAVETHTMGNSQSKESDLDSNDPGNSSSLEDNDNSRFDFEFEDLRFSSAKESQNQAGADSTQPRSNNVSPITSDSVNSDELSESSSVNFEIDKEIPKQLQEYRPRLGSAERNVFDAFPVDIPASSENSATSEIESENSDSTVEQTVNQRENQKNDAPEASVKAASDFLSSFEKFLQNQSPDEKSDSTSTKSEEPVKNIPVNKAICKPKRRPIFKTFARSQKLRRGSNSKETAATDLTSDSDESDAFMKAKQKYQCLKELRVSLNATEIVNLNVHVVGKPSKTLQRNFIAKSKLSKINTAKQTGESESDAGLDQLREELILSVGDDLKTDTFKSPVKTSLEESTKPLKKRSRRSDNEMVHQDELTESEKIKNNNADEEKSENFSDISHCKENLSDVDLCNGESQISAENFTSVNIIKKSCWENTTDTEGEQSVEKVLLDRSKNSKTLEKQKIKSSSKLPASESDKHSVQSEANHENAHKKDELSNTKEDIFCCPNADSLPKKYDKVSTVIKKYPERSCKLRMIIPENKVNKKDDSKSKVSVTSSKKSSDNPQSHKISIPSTKKKKRKRKVKPWSWGNEKKRYKPKPKLDSEASDFTENESSNVEHETTKTESSETKYSDSELTDLCHEPFQSQLTKSDESESLAIAKSGRVEYAVSEKNSVQMKKKHETSTETNALKDNGEHLTEEESTEVEENFFNEAKAASGKTKNQRKRCKVKKGNQKKKEKNSIKPYKNVEKDSDDHEISFYAGDNHDENHFLTNSYQLEANDHELPEENFPPNVSPDSGIQSLTGSPAGHESPNLAFNQHCSVTANSNSLKINTASSSNQIIDSKNGIVSSILCAAASASLSSTSVTTSVTSSTETVSVFSKSVPISSVTATMPFNPLPFCDMLTSSTNFIAFPVLDPQINGANLNSNNMDLTKDACSKKKNRAKFLKRHKASTLLQKGRLPTEEEKEQRLEDKFDYLSKVGATPVFDETEFLNTNFIGAQESHDHSHIYENNENTDIGLDNESCSESLNKSCERTDFENTVIVKGTGDLEDGGKELKERTKDWKSRKTSKLNKRPKKGKQNSRADTRKSDIKDNEQLQTSRDESLLLSEEKFIENNNANEEEKITEITKNKKRGRKKKEIKNNQKNLNLKITDNIVDEFAEENIETSNNAKDCEPTTPTETDLQEHILQEKVNTEDDYAEEFVKYEDFEENEPTENNSNIQVIESEVSKRHVDVIEPSEIAQVENIHTVTNSHLKRKGRTKRKRGRSKGTSSERKNINTQISKLDSVSVERNDSVPMPDIPDSSSESVFSSPNSVRDGPFVCVPSSETVTDISLKDIRSKNLSPSINDSETDSEQVKKIDNFESATSEILDEKVDENTVKKGIRIDNNADPLLLNAETASLLGLNAPILEVIPVKRKRGRPAKKKNGTRIQRTKLISKLTSPPYSSPNYKPTSFRSPSYRSSSYKYHPARSPPFKFLTGRSPPYKPFSVRSPIYKPFPAKSTPYKTLTCKSPPYKQKYQEHIIKRKRGRPKGSKNKVKTNSILHQGHIQHTVIQQTAPRPVGRPPLLAGKRPRGRPKGSLNKVKKTSVFPEKSGHQTEANSHLVESSEPMMQWRESKIIPEGEEKKRRRGRPPKKSLSADPNVRKSSPKGKEMPKKADLPVQSSPATESLDSVAQTLPIGSPERLDFPPGPDEWLSDHSTSFLKDKIKRKKMKSDQKSRSYLEPGDRILQPPRMCHEQESDVGTDFSGREPAQSVSSLDSDTSGGGSSLGVKTSAIQMWMEISKHRKKKNKKKLLHFRSKHKNIIDPVFNAEVDYLTNMIPRLSISPRGETYLKVRPGEMPLPSIFRIARIDVKKKKKDKLFVFEKAKPLKPKNDTELSTKDKIRLGRKISMLSENFLDPDDLNSLQQCNLPPKKRLKLFSTMGSDNESLSEGHQKPEKRKGRPRKTHPATQQKRFAFGEGQHRKDHFSLGKDGCDDMASFASVAMSGQSLSAFSPSRESLPDLSTVANLEALLETSTSTTVNNTHTVLPDVTENNLGGTNSVSEWITQEHSGQLSLETGTCDIQSSKSCDRCSLNKSCDRDDSSGVESSVAGYKLSGKLLNRNVRQLKRKYRKRAKSPFLKKSRVQKLVTENTKGDQLSGEESQDWSVRSVCSESEPLPVIHQEKQKWDSDEDCDSVDAKRAKVQKRRMSDESQESDTSIVKRREGVFQKKKYQKAGLYSDSYKDELSKEKDTSSMIFQFDLPLHFGNHQLKNTSDFQLPYDVWGLHFNDMLPKKGDGQQYRRIRNNIYVDARPACRYEAHSCNCRLPQNNEKGCGEDCLNRLIYTECSQDLCPCADQCSNQAIQKHQFAPGLQKFLTKDRGFGVRTTKPVKTGDLITEYLGEVVSEQEFRRRMTEEYSQECHHYCLNLDSGTVIDGYRMGNIARFVNHSCEPNCEMQKWNVNGTYHMCLFALTDIEPGSELVYDYNFQSFNHDAQQICKCGSDSCRGIIGGRKQWQNGQAKQQERVPGKLKGKHGKDKRKSKLKQEKGKDSPKMKYPVQPIVTNSSYNQTMPLVGGTPIPAYLSPLSLKPITKKERHFARQHAIFLVRNLDRLRSKLRQEREEQKQCKDVDYVKGTHFTKKDVFMSQLTALKTSRSVKTRRLTVAEEDSELGKKARLAGVCREIFSAISAAKDDDGIYMATDLYHLPSRKKHPLYYQMIDEPIDLTMIENKILSGEYHSIDMFERDVMKLFQNVEMYCGKKSEMGERMRQLRLVYHTAKRVEMNQLNEILGLDNLADVQSGTTSDAESMDNVQVSTPAMSTSGESDISEGFENNKGEWTPGEEEEEEVINCICGIYKDEGLMIQCEKCYIWQHTDCMKVKGDEENYLCHECDPRIVDREVEIVGNSEEEEVHKDGNRYYMTLMRDDMQIRLGSCVYVMKENKSRRYSYKKSGGLNKEQLDIFRIERLWKNEKGEKYAFGHTYVRPHETFHEPTRKFFPNEVFRTPLYEVFPLESIVGYCCVLDLLTNCKGHPKGYKQEDIYICEYRMDKTLHLFYKISPKLRYPVNTKSYCFIMYDKRLNPRRTYSPHEVPESYKRNWREKSSSSTEGPEKKPVIDEEDNVPLLKVKIERRKEKRERVNKIMDSLGKGITSPSKKRNDLTYLLTNANFDR